jgi:hypothetical protein
VLEAVSFIALFLVLSRPSIEGGSKRIQSVGLRGPQSESVNEIYSGRAKRFAGNARLRRLKPDCQRSHGGLDEDA